MKLQIIVGSTRPGRAAESVLKWVHERAQASDGFTEVEVLDLRDWPLPMFQETRDTIGDPADPTYSDPIVRRWNRTIASGDAYLLITPEYNHSVPGVLKNALDSIFVSAAFRNKPGGFIAYSGGIAAGVRAIEHLAHIVIEMELIPMRNSVLIPRVNQAFGEDGNPVDPMTNAALTILMEDLAWWGEVLSNARPHQLPPGSRRLAEALRASG